MKIFKYLTVLSALAFPPTFLLAEHINFDSLSNDITKQTSNTYQPKDKLDKFIIDGANYLSKFVEDLNNQKNGNFYLNTMKDDAKSLIANKGWNYLNSTANNKIQKIPFFAQTNISINGGTESDTSFSINSLIKLGELSKDDKGDLKTLAFSQARFATATKAEGSTINLGLGLRHRPNEISMIGANTFWDYRITDYSDSHSRFGLGGEYFWKDFEFRNNWYMAMTDSKSVNIDGVSFNERVVPGWDAELGYRLPNKPELAFFVRGFNWDYKNTQDNSGLEGSVSWQATPNVGITAFLSNEISGFSTTSNANLPDTDDIFYGFRLNITGRPIRYQKKDYKKNMITKMVQPVKRKYDVLLERSGGSFQNRAKGS